MWTSLWNYAPTPEELAYQEKKKEFVRNVQAVDQRINDQRPEDEDEEKLRLLSLATSLNDAQKSLAASGASNLTSNDETGGSNTSSPSPAALRGRGVLPSSISIIPSMELDKTLSDLESSLQNFSLKIDWNVLIPYDEARRAAEKTELELLQRKLDVARYNLIAKVGPYRPLDPTLLFPSHLPRIVAPSLSPWTAKEKEEVDSLLSAVGYKEEGAGVGSFDLLHPDFCERLMREANAMAFWTEAVEQRGVFAAYWGFRKTSKNRHVVLTPSLKGVLLNHAAGSFAFMNALVKQAIEPVVSTRAEKERGVRVFLHPRSCRVFSYCMDDIGMSDHYHHKPETGIAVNICLGRDFTGANLLLTDDSGTRLSIPQIAGRALVFRAEANVSTETITGGERYNMVIYCDVTEEEEEKHTHADVDHDNNSAEAATSSSSSAEQQATLLGLPEPLKHRVLTYLSLNDLNAVTLTSDACFKLVTYQSLPVWERLCHEKQYPHAQDENWRRSFINGHKAQLLKRWRDQERKREQKKLFNEGMAEGYFMHDFDIVDRFEDENARAAGGKKRNPWKDYHGQADNDDDGQFYGLGQDGLHAPHQMWNCCVLQ